MKLLFLSLLSFLLVYKCDAQLLKKLGDKVKRDAEWRIRYKADRQVDKALDSIIETPKKIIEKKKAKKSSSQTTIVTDQNKNVDHNKNPENINAEAKDENDVTSGEGFIKLSLSNKTAYTGFGIAIGIRISGESVKYKNYNQVQLLITGRATQYATQVQMGTDGKFYLDWNPTNTGKDTGMFTVTAISSDKKEKKSATFSVKPFKLPHYDDWPGQNISETKKALEKLETAVDMVRDGIGSKDKAELDKKMKELKEKVDDVLVLFKDLGKANKDMMQLAEKEKKLPPNYAEYLAELYRSLDDQASQMKKINETAVHKPQDNTICEYLVMTSEACAAFSTFTNIWSRSLATIAKNIVIDKAIPATVGAMNNNRVSGNVEFSGKESSKIFATSLFDAESLSSKLGRAGFAGDFIQYTSDVLLKTYCGVFKGDFKHDYEIISRNNKGEIWYKYGTKMESTFSLRYPKSKNQGNVIKMKGNLEGNATNFSFFADLEKEDGFQEGSKGKIEIVPLHVYKPAALPFATSKNDPGFGAVARGIATPAYFNIPVDAEYDVDADKIKIFLNPAIVDFTDLVTTQFLFLEVGGDLLPYIKKMNFPIAKAASTIGSVIRPNNEFVVDKDSKGNISFTGKGNRHIGSKADKIEIDLNFSITATKQ